MSFSQDQIAAFHKALHEACNLPALRMSMSDERSWWDFLREMDPLVDHPMGAFSTTDIVQVLRHMQWEVREGKASWALRPTHIPRNPETFRDLMLITRQKRTPQKVRKPVATAPIQVPEDDRLTAEESLESLARMKRQINGGAA